MVTTMRHLFLFSLIAFSTTIHAAELEKIWELELQITGETRRLVVELTDEPSESCSFGRARKVRTIEGKVRTHEFFSGYSYAVYDGVIIIDLLPLICDAGNLLR